MTATLLKFPAPARREPEAWPPLRQCVGRDTHTSWPPPVVVWPIWQTAAVTFTSSLILWSLAYGAYHVIATAAIRGMTESLK